MGGPVVFQAGSLLARYFRDKPSPGMAKDAVRLQQLCNRLQDGDRSFIDDVVSSQRDVCKLYDPGYVWPLFDQAFREMLDTGTSPGLRAHLASGSFPIPFPAKAAPPTDRTLVLFHSLLQASYEFRDPSDGKHPVTNALRVAIRIVRSLIASGKHVVVTALHADLIAVQNFLELEAKQRCQLVLWCIDDGPQSLPLPLSHKRRRRTLRDIIRPLRRSFGRLLSNAKPGPRVRRPAAGRRWLEPVSKPDLARYMNTLNAEPSITRVIVPDATIFPEVSRLLGKNVYVQYQRPDDLKAVSMLPGIHWFAVGTSAGSITAAAQPLCALPPDDPEFSASVLGLLGLRN